MADLTGALQAAAGTAASAGEATDPNFNQTVLLLHGDGTNGAQNNTFLDSSTNNFTITRNGNTTQGTFSPFSLPNGEWSNYLPGSGSILYTGVSTALSFDADFTVEGWFNLANFANASAGGNPGLIGFGTPNWVLVCPGGEYTFYAGNSIVFETTTVGITANTWHHFALVRSGSTITMYHNGVSVATATNSSTLNIGASGVTVGSNGTGGIGSVTGYISNIRVVKGTAVYTSAFTPPTEPLTAIANTQLLVCQSNRFKDNSSNNFSVTLESGPSVQPFSPFLPTAAYSASVNGASGYFDGSDTLSIAQTTATDLGNGNWTLESWVYPTAAFTNNARVFHKTGAGSNNWIVRFDATTGYPYLEIDASSIVTGNAAPPLNSWSHLAVVRNSNTVTIYLNGASVGSATYTGTPSSPSAATYFASNANTNEFFTGYLANSRFVKGTAVYTSAFTPPTSPLTAIANTSFLLNFTNAGIFDNTGKNNLETVADAQIDTSVKKYGTGSIEFDGTGDYLVLRNSPELSFGAGAYTVEFWLNTTATGGWLIYKEAGDTGFRLAISTNGDGTANLSKINLNEQVSNVNHYIDSTSTINDGNWHHIAIVREAGSGTRIYIDGTSEAQQPAVYNFDNTGNMFVGVRASLGGVALDGFIDDLRITKGVARYTTTFTPPTAAFLDL
jgi:hypothetical protein